MTKLIRCAIYTRKSSDEGLEQSFNSLDAQREAGEAYIKSQAHEGWKASASRYDDGGYSGGTMERPGLKALLADIDAGLIDVVVVYKIDRLTRSLADFARIVERFDAREVSFVSVTQAFNTTSSMGRLTLNVLLSFAQFEREVTGERIRDKIAASKAKGMWMGGVPPLGYDLPAPGTRTLRVNEAEAGTVRSIFERYLASRSVHALERQLASDVILSKRHVTSNGKVIGGLPFSRGALFHLLRNRTYLGQIVHRGTAHQGEHWPIIEQVLFDQVQAVLDANARRHGTRQDRALVRAPLTGKLFDASGEPMSPAFSRGKSGKAYRYYVSASLQQGAKPTPGVIQRLSAPEIEQLVEALVKRWVTGSVGINLVAEVRLLTDGLVVTLEGDRAPEVVPRLASGEQVIRATRARTVIQVEAMLQRRGGATRVIASSDRGQRRDPALIKALRKAHRMITRREGLMLVQEAPVSPYDKRILRLAFLAPSIQADILGGRQPSALTLERLVKTEIPLGWQDQRKQLGWCDV